MQILIEIIETLMAVVPGLLYHYVTHKEEPTNENYIS